MVTSLPIENVSTTAFLTAYCRAVESDRRDAHFRDPYARLLAGTHGREALRRVPAPELTVAASTVRTCQLDALIIDAIRDQMIDTVLNLGAGLDMRPYRLPAPSDLRWIEIDREDVLSYKRRLVFDRPICQLEALALDLADPEARSDVFRQIGSRSRKLLILTEGLLVYFTAEQVAALARDLREIAQQRWWLTDIVSPFALELIQRSRVDQPRDGDLELTFAPAEGAYVFREWGWEPERVLWSLDEAERLRRWFIREELWSTRLSVRQRQTLQRLFAAVKLNGNRPNKERCA
ncbi:MAG TPA: class I SAM-dependent methyltransferase [Pirellulales bacterium]|nr:class I SAM-dependent methyltransferase [Pirellulales bacterium]